MIACKQCDSLYATPELSEGQTALCACCGTTLFSRKKDYLNRTIAIAIAGLLFFIPAIYLPLVGISAAGIVNSASLIDCITLMIDGKFYIIAFAVFMLAVAIPVVRLYTALYISLCIKFNHVKPSLAVFFNSYHVLDHWTMVHVFFMGVIVSMYKLISLAEMLVDFGLLAMVLLLICSTLLSLTMDEHAIWEELEKAVD